MQGMSAINHNKHLPPLQKSSLQLLMQGINKSYFVLKG